MHPPTDPHDSGYRCLNTPMGTSIHMLGPDLNQGPLPAVFYFALSGKDSLTLDPYNQPAMQLAEFPIRVFSFSIPGHGEGLDNAKAMSYWSKEISKGYNIIYDFIEECSRYIDHLHDEGYLEAGRLGAAGLSRGGFIATHLAALDPRIGTILGFSPLTRLDLMDEFQDIRNQPLVRALGLNSIVEKLVGRQLRFYIGNRDTRVGTDHCFQFIKELADTAYQHRIRSPAVEMIISPSIGHKGHGTSLETFQDGANWLSKELLG